MAETLFRWIYCMNIPSLMMLIAAASVLFSFGYRRYREKRWCKPAIGVLLLGSTTAILAVTLLTRSGQTESLVPSMVPFASYKEVFNGCNRENLRSNFMNVVLFYPSGFLSVLLLPQRWKRVLNISLVWLVFACISVGIEYCQYVCALGQAEVDDVIHNTLGTFIGTLTGYYLSKRSR